MTFRATIIAALLLIASGAHAGDAIATFSIDADQKPMVSVVAISEDHPMAKATHQWLTLNFYAYTPTEAEKADAAKGDLKAIDSRIHEGDNYNNSHAKLILSVDKTNQQITQVDISVPGYSCTVAYTPEHLKNFASNYQFKDNQISLKADGTFECNLDKKVQFGWKVDINTPVYPALIK